MNDENKLIPTESTMNQGGAFSSIKAFEDALRMVKPLTRSSLVPQHFKGEEGTANAVIALEMAQRIGASPLMVMQNLYVVHGNPGWSAQFIIAALNGCGRYEPLEFHMVGDEGNDTWGCYVTAKRKSDGIELKGPKVTLKMANDEGWSKKNGSKWRTMPEIMLRYRAASFFGKNYAPDILMGMQTAEELHDIYDGDGNRVGANTAAVIQKTKDITPPSYAEIREMIQNSDSYDEAVAALRMGNHLPDEQREELEIIVNSMKGEE